MELTNSELCDKIKRLSELLAEARDTVRASRAEDGISQMRLDYRTNLERRIKEELAR